MRKFTKFLALLLLAISHGVYAQRTMSTPLGNIVAFSGRDAFFLDVNPLKGLTQLTLEAVFKPDGNGEFAQRFLHLGLLSGERQNLVSWFKGSMYRLRVTPRPLSLSEFLNDHQALNQFLHP